MRVRLFFCAKKAYERFILRDGYVMHIDRIKRPGIFCLTISIRLIKYFNSRLKSGYKDNIHQYIDKYNGNYPDKLLTLCAAGVSIYTT